MTGPDASVQDRYDFDFDRKILPQKAFLKSMLLIILFTMEQTNIIENYLGIKALEFILILNEFSLVKLYFS